MNIDYKEFQKYATKDMWAFSLVDCGIMKIV